MKKILSIISILIISVSYGQQQTTVENCTDEDLEYYLFIPNGFTPNSDELNNIFLPHLHGNVDIYSYSLEIYNRWGEIIFESKNINYGWDGTYNGEIVQEGVYIWKIYFKTKVEDDNILKFGNINLIK